MGGLRKSIFKLSIRLFDNQKLYYISIYLIGKTKNQLFYSDRLISDTVNENGKLQGLFEQSNSQE